MHKANHPMSPYHTAISRLLSLADFERKSRAGQPPDWHLRRVQRLMELLGEPHRAKPVVHVAGSKGKGSTSAFIASVLTANGYRTGHYTSPHLHRFTERIAVDGVPVSETQFARLVGELWHCVESIEAQGDIGTVSVFEMLTAMAFVQFRDYADLDVSVIEVGLGGRLDATNVVVPVVSVITPISLDHVAVLGNTVAEIAAEKAGIIKPGVPVVMAGQLLEAAVVIEEKSKEVNSELHDAMSIATPYVPGDEGVNNEYQGHASILSDFGTINCEVQMLGTHQLDNARTAITTLQLLRDSGFALDRARVERGLAETRWHCRTELVNTRVGVPVLLDGAHNDASASALAATVIGHPALRSRKVCLVLGATAGHDVGAVARELRAIEPSNIIATSSRHPKSLPADTVQQAASALGYASVTTSPTVASAVNVAEAYVRYGGADLIVATGSLFVAAEAREHILGIEPELYDDIPDGYMHTYRSG